MSAHDAANPTSRSLVGVHCLRPRQGWRATGHVIGDNARVQNRMRSGNGVVSIRISMALVVVAAIIAWIAVGTSVESSRSDRRATAATLAAGLALADSSASLAGQLKVSIDALVVGVGSAGESIAHSIEISENVTSLLDLVRGLAGVDGAKATDIATGLADAQASLLENQGGLGETSATLAAAQPPIDAAVIALQAAPDQWRSAQKALDRSSPTYTEQLWLWRLAIVIAALASILALVVLVSRAGVRQGAERAPGQRDPVQP